MSKENKKHDYIVVDSVIEGDRLSYRIDGEWVDCIVVGWHPHHPMVVVDSDGEFGGVSLSALHKKVEVIEQKLAVEAMGLIDACTDDVSSVLGVVHRMIAAGYRLKEKQQWP